MQTKQIPKTGYERFQGRLLLLTLKDPFVPCYEKREYCDRTMAAKERLSDSFQTKAFGFSVPKQTTKNPRPGNRPSSNNSESRASVNVLK